MSLTQPLAYAYYNNLRAKKQDKRSTTGPFLDWTPPGAWGVPLALFRETDGILMVSPARLLPDTLISLPPAPVWHEEDVEISGRITVTQEGETPHD